MSENKSYQPINLDFLKKIKNPYLARIILISILVAGGYAASQGAQISLSVYLQARLDALDNQISIPVNSSLSGVQKPCSYIVSMVDTYCCMQNGTADRGGRLEYFSINTSQVIYNALGNLTSGRTNMQTIILEGNFTLNTKIFLNSSSYSHTKIVLDGMITAANGLNDWMFQIGTQVTDIDISGGIWDGDKAGQSAANLTPLYLDCSNFKVHDLTIQNSYGYGLWIYDNASNWQLNNIYTHDNGYDGIAINGRSGILTNIISYNNTFEGLLFFGAQNITMSTIFSYDNNDTGFIFATSGDANGGPRPACNIIGNGLIAHDNTLHGFDIATGTNGIPSYGITLDVQSYNNGYDGVIFEQQSHDNSVSGLSNNNTVYNVAVSTSNNNTVSNMKILNSKTYGVYVYQSNYTRITNNDIATNGWGSPGAYDDIYIYGSPNSTIENNNIISDGVTTAFGVNGGASDNTTIENNYFSNFANGTIITATTIGSNTPFMNNFGYNPVSGRLGLGSSQVSGSLLNDLGGGGPQNNTLYTVNESPKTFTFYGFTGLTVYIDGQIWLSSVTSGQTPVLQCGETFKEVYSIIGTQWCDIG